MSSASRAEERAPAPAPAITEAPERSVSYRSLLVFYLPLGFSGVMMALDLPVVNAVLNRLPNPDVSVAALRVAFSLALVYEAAHVSMIDTSTTLSGDLRVFYMLRRFYVVMSVALLAVASAFAFSPAYDWVVRDVMSIPPEVVSAARPAFWAFLLWPIPIGWRRLYQGALIRHGHPRPVGAGGVVRLGSLCAALLVFGWLGTSVVHIEPAAIGVLSILVSVTAEAVAVHGWTTRILRGIRVPATGEHGHSGLPTYRDLWRFVFPLAGTSVMSTLTQPILTAAIASAAIAWASPGGSVVSVAGYAIAWSASFLLFGPTLSMTQASIAWHSSPDPQVRERGPRVIVGVGVGLALLLAAWAFSPFAHWFFSTILQAPEETARMATTVARWLSPLPLLSSLSYLLRGKLIARHDPHAVRMAQFFDLAAIFAITQVALLPPLARFFHGALAAPFAAAAYGLMLCVDIAILLLAIRRRRAG